MCSGHGCEVGPRASSAPQCLRPGTPLRRGGGGHGPGACPNPPPPPMPCQTGGGSPREGRSARPRIVRAAWRTEWGRGGAAAALRPVAPFRGGVWDTGCVPSGLLGCGVGGGRGGDRRGGLVRGAERQWTRRPPLVLASELQRTAPVPCHRRAFCL